MHIRPSVLGILRVSLAARPIPAFHCTRPFSVLHGRNRLTFSWPNRVERRAYPFQQCSRRMISLGSIFSSNPEGTPPPHVVALITRLEAEANVHPHDVSKQLALFEALMDTDMKSSYELVISRWDKVCEFDPSSPLLQSAEAFKVYLTCLEKVGQSALINVAVQKRDELLVKSGASIATDPANSTAPQQSSPLTPPSPDSAVSKPLADPPALTASQVIANQVLSKSDAHGTSTSPTPIMDSFRLSGNSSQKAPLQVTIVERKGAWIPRLVRFIILVIVSSFFLLVILSVFFENTGFMKAGPRQTQFEPSEGKAVKFTEVHGVDEAKEELEDVVAFLKDPAAFSTLGGKLPKGVLLTGPPGTGKTLLARAVAGEAGVPFFFASGSDFEEMFVGVGAKRVRELFAAARKKQPAIIFIDELDAVGGKRSHRDQQYMKQTLNQLLVELDGFQQSEGVIVIAATNFPESLDQALVRPGRFDRTIAVPLPDIRGRIQILQHHLKGITVGNGVDPKILARSTSGMSGADLQNMVNQAAIYASKLHAKEVNTDHFDWARDRILMGAERKSAYIEDKVKLVTAYHEGGHALVALYTEGAMPLHKVTCVPRGHSLGMTKLLPLDDRVSVTHKEYLADIAVSMGGRIAEELIYGKDQISSGASSDIGRATKVAQAMVKQWGFSKLGPILYDDRDGSLSSRKMEQIEEEITRLVREGEDRAMALLSSRIDELHRLAHALVEHETLNAEEVQKVVKGEAIRTITEVLEEDISHIEP